MKYNITVTRTDEYEIEVDETVWDKDALNEWSSVFHPVFDTEDVAKDFAVAWMRNENNYFIEGYGYVKEIDSNGTVRNVPFIDENGKPGSLPDEKFAKGISICPISQDENYEAEINP